MSDDDQKYSQRDYEDEIRRHKERYYLEQSDVNARKKWEREQQILHAEAERERARLEDHMSGKWESEKEYMWKPPMTEHRDQVNLNRKEIVNLLDHLGKCQRDIVKLKDKIKEITLTHDAEMISQETRIEALEKGRLNPVEWKDVLDFSLLGDE